jgi:diguanylate cyclase (GGDEF)-like protein
LRLSDWIARFGGEEFVLVLPDTDMEGAWVPAEMVLEGCESATMVLTETEIIVTASFGVAQLILSATDAESAEALLRRADAALYEAKRAGGNCVMRAVEIARARDDNSCTA